MEPAEPGGDRARRRQPRRVDGARGSGGQCPRSCEGATRPSERTASFKNESSARKSEAAIRYFNDMIMAEREWSSGNVQRVELLLDEWDPKPGQDNARVGSGIT